MKKKFLPKVVTNARIEMRTRTSTIKQTQMGMTTRTKGVVTMASMRTSTAKARVTTTATRNLMKKGGERGGRGRARGKVREESEGEADGDEIAPVGEDQFKTDVAPTRANQSLIILEEKLDDFVTNILKAWQSSHRRSSDAHLRQTTTKMFVDGCRQVYVSGQFTTKVTFAQKLTRALSTLLAAFVKEQGNDDAQSKGIQRWVSALEGELLSLWTYTFEF
jgi:hypothetical protein